MKANDESRPADIVQCKSIPVCQGNDREAPHNPVREFVALRRKVAHERKENGPKGRPGGPRVRFADPETDALAEKVWEEIELSPHRPISDFLEISAKSGHEKG